MADFKKVWKWIVNWESTTYANHPLDKGGPTKFGITLETFKTFGRDLNGDGVINAKDVAQMTIADAEQIAKKEFWDFFAGDEINNQSLAQIIMDFGWASGIVTAAKIVQGILKVNRDGVFGPKTIAAINKADAATLFDTIKKRRLAYVDGIVANDQKQVIWLKGWKRRINDITFPI
jgi:lysozyme family protein